MLGSKALRLPARPVLLYGLRIVVCSILKSLLFLSVENFGDHAPVLAA
jgi:hypothetical protein